jgi:N-acetylneuraminic acid mutarotase
MSYTNNPSNDEQKKLVIRIRLRKPNFAYMGKGLLFAPKNAFVRLMNAQFRYRFIAAIGIIVLAELYSVLTPFFQESSYAIGKGDILLPEVSPEMASKIKFNGSNQAFEFNKDPSSDPGAVGAEYYASSTVHKDPSKGITTTDSKNNVDFTMIPKFDMKTGRQEQNRIVYPLSDGSGWVVYSMQGVGVKEDIILNYARGDAASYAYTLQLGSSLKAKLQDDGSVGIFGNTLLSGNVATGSDKDAELLAKARENASKDTLLFGIPAPVVVDKHGPADGISSKYSLDGSTLTVHVSGLKKGNYPLSIDPSIYIATAKQFMAGNNETNINFDVNNKLIKKGRTTGARFDQWQTTSSLPQAVWGAQTVATGGYIYSVGGTTSSSTSTSVNWAQLNTTTSTVDSANPGSGACSTWCSDSAYALPDGRSNFSLTTYNGYLYVMGGTSSNCTSGNGTGTTGYCKTVYVAKLGANGEPRLWHPTDGNPNNWGYWYRAGDLPTERAYSSAVAYNNRMYFMGGRTASGATTALHIADITPTGTLGSWSSSTVLPSTNQYATSAQVYNDRLYIVGGSTSPTAAPTNTVYFNKINSNGTINSWVQTSSFATGRTSGGSNISVVRGGYIYVSGGCSAVNGSGYCTTTQNDTQVASINADGSVDTWNSVTGASDARLGHSLVTWRNTLYEVGGCSSQDTTTGDCNSNVLSSIKYGVINQDGDASMLNTSVSSGSSTCSGGDPYGCDLPSASVGNVLNATAVINGYLYVMGGCTNDACSTVSTGITYQAIGSDGKLKKPSTCSGSFTDSYCVSSVSLPTGLAATGTAVFNNRIYLVGGIGTGTNIYYVTNNADGSLSAWSNASLATVSSSAVTTLSYSYAYARANPASASTNPGNLYIIGGCTNAAVNCSGYSQAVLKCNIGTSGAPASCSTSGQLQIGSIPNSCGTGIAAVSGTVYANYVYLIGGITSSCSNLKTTRYAKIDNSNNIVTVGSGWVEGANQMSVGRHRGAGFGYNGYLYVVGGYDTSGPGILSDIEFAKINVSDGSWETWNNSTATINQRWGLNVLVSNSYAYVIGGCTTGAAPSSCSARTNNIQTFQLYNNNSGAPAGYSTSANTFSTDPNRVGVSSAVLNGYIYAAGGCTSFVTYCTDTTNNVSYAALDTYGNVGTWSNTSANLPADRGWGKLRVAGGSLYYIGGQSDTPTDFRTEVYYATPSSGNVSSWSTASNGLPNARTNFGSAVWNDRLYVVGGQGSGTGCASGVCNTVYVSPQLTSGGNITSAWSTTSTGFTVARSGLTAIAYANNLYVLGGNDSANYLTDTQYTKIISNPGQSDDGTVGSWTSSETLPLPVSQGDGFAANGYIYLFGGRTGETSCDPTTLIAPISANTTVASGNNPTGIGSWFETNQRYSGARFGNAAVYTDGKAYVVGGMNCTGGSSYATSGTYSYVVPAGVTSITVKMWGAGGGGGGGGFNTSSPKNGGGGGYVTSTISVTPGETLALAVGGGGGGGGTNGAGAGQGAGGGGGGYSSVYRSTTPLLIAGGGGGGGGGNSTASTVHGGPGGGTSGIAGSATSPVNPAGGGTASAGGAAGTGGQCSGQAGSSLTGGKGGTAGCGTGGGGAAGTTGGGTGGGPYNFFGTTLGGGGGAGGGYFGGGGGGTGNNQGVAGGGGGGGSSYTTGTSVTNTAGSHTPTLGAPGNATDTDRGTAGNGGGGGATAGTPGSAGNSGLIILSSPQAVSPITPVVQQTAILSQPQVAKYSIMFDTDSDVFPTHWLLNGLDNSIGARWQLKYRSATDATKATVAGGAAGRNCSTAETMSSWGSETNFGNVTLGLPGLYTARDSSNNNTNCARFYNFNVTVDSSQAYGYPDDVSRGPTITDLTLNMTADPAKRLLHGRTFIGGLQMPIDTPYNSN